MDYAFDRSVYPRPDFIRTEYMSLNGTWEITFPHDGKLKKNIIVPFPYQSEASGIGMRDHYDTMRYHRSVKLPESSKGKRIILHFGAVDHSARVYINACFATEHSGGYTPFACDITEFVCGDCFDIDVYVTDTRSRSQCRGKQTWDPEPSRVHYYETSGIWQEVWLEFVPDAHIVSIKYTPDLDKLCCYADIRFNKAVSGTLSASVYNHEGTLMQLSASVEGEFARMVFPFDDYGYHDANHLMWTPDIPNLVCVDMTLTCGDIADTVYTYFGMRKVHVFEDRVFLNNVHFYMRLVLDQGYWKEGMYRPADDSGFKKDVELTKAMGFNGVRKHQKFEDPKFLYWADRLGLLVWGELPSFYRFCEDAQKDALRSMEEYIDRDYNHPSLVCYVPINETWGLRHNIGDPRQGDLARCLYYLCKTKDPTRLVSTIDGWENVNPTDILPLHEYREMGERMKQCYDDPAFVTSSSSARAGHPFMSPGEKYEGQPIILTEFSAAMWPEKYETDAQFLAALRKSVDDLIDIKSIRGYCYTQLTDVYQERNGLLDMDRNPKLPIEEIAAIFGRNPIRLSY